MERIRGNKTLNASLDETKDSRENINSEFKHFQKVTRTSDLLLLNHKSTPVQDKYVQSKYMIEEFTKVTTTTSYYY